MGDQLPEVVLQSVLAKTEASDCARVGCVNQRWRQNSSEDSLWQSYCLRDFALSSPLDPRGNPCGSFKAAYKSWRTVLKEYPMPLVARAKRCIDEIKDWLKINFVEVLDSLVPGASFEEIEEVEEKLGFQLPAPVRLLYFLCNGQELPPDEDYDDSDSHVSNLVGLLGGYYFYQHFVNVHLLPLAQLVKLTLIVRNGEIPPRSRRVVIGASYNSPKMFFLDCDDGQVYVGTKNFQGYGEMMPCTPMQEGGVDLKDGMLRWLERYNECLQTGMYRVRVENYIRSISLFPSKEPLSTGATTRGVQIRASAIFVPELSKPMPETPDEEEDDDNFVFGYSVDMRLLAPSSGYGNSPMETVQLLARHWIIQPNGFSKAEVSGPAVIGQYPLLRAGGEEFVYQSCSPLQGKSGCIEGDFTFVPGRITRPGGAEFIAYVARFPLEVPQYIF